MGLGVLFVFGWCLDGRRMLSNEEARNSVISSNHWAWNRGVRLMVHFLGHKRKWSKVDAHKTTFELKRWNEM